MKIYPAKSNSIVSKEFIDLYERIVRLTCGSSDWNASYYHIHPECHLTLQESIPVYYIYEITGDLGDDDNDCERDPFKIILKHNALVAEIGDISSLNKVLDILERKKHDSGRSSILTYERQHCQFIEEEIHQWMMKGCPNVGLSYQLQVGIFSKKLSISEISTKNVIINFLGISNSIINIIDKLTGDQWTFTDDYNYANVYHNNFNYLQSSSSIYRSKDNNPSEPSQYVTSELEARALSLIGSVKELLLQ